MRPAAYLLSPFLLAVLASCHDDCCDVPPPPPPPQPRPVSILVEVYDPVTNFVWQGVGVRVVEASHEWSGCVCPSPYQDWFLTDEFGEVWLDEFILAEAEVGFLEDGAGGAVIWPGRLEDEASVLLEIDALGFAPVLVEVDLSWDEPDVFVSVPFEPEL